MCWPSPESRPLRIAPLDAATYRRHAIHGEDRTWPETNCYTDLLIEVAHGFGHPPEAMLGFTLGIDFEGDQWTFFKPRAADLYALYGFDLQELALWKPLIEHVVEQVDRGHPVLVELDSWFLPDTSGSAYRTQHTKTTVGVNEIDIARGRMGYFHNASYYAVEGEDFRQLFQLDGAPHERVLPPYVEYIKWRPGFRKLEGQALADLAAGLLPDHVARIPRENPFRAFRARFDADLGWLLGADIGRFHAYSFATLRQYGACFELAATHLRWLGSHGVDRLEAPAAGLQSIAEAAKAFQFQLARAMARGKPLDLTSLDTMGQAWERAMAPLAARFG
jgi:hypothetical protein